MKDPTVIVLVKHTIAGEMLDFRRPFCRNAVIVNRPPGRSIATGKRDVEVVVEFRVVGRDPSELPTHPFAHSLNFLDRCARHRYVGNVVIFEMRKYSVNVIDFE